MSSKYVDIVSIVQVIGCVYNNPLLLDFGDKYIISEDDFPDMFHKVVFGTIYKLFESGATKITLSNILDYLSSRPKSEAIFKSQKGEEWLLSIADKATPQSFDYYYNRLKKFTLLRAYDDLGLNVTDIYDPDIILDAKKKQLQEDTFDNLTVDQIALKIEGKIEDIRYRYVNDEYGEAEQIGEGIDDLLEELEKHPEVGIPLYGPFINTVTRGARLGKFYLRSAPTGVGKSRTMVADACYIGCAMMYNEDFGCWLTTGKAQPTLYITTEQDKKEVQTMMLAFLSNVNEEHILNNSYELDEKERVLKAAQILKDSPLYLQTMPDFSLQDIEDKIKKNIRDHDVSYIFLDYIHTSLKILEEISKRSGGVKLREDNILFMMSIRLKDLCNKYGVFIMSATQLNSDYQEAETPDQNLLRGAKSIADKIDVGSILLPVKEKDKEALSTILAANAFPVPDLKLSIYKNRRGRYKGIYLWCKADLGTCRVEPMFATSWSYDVVQMIDLKIKVEEPSAF